MPQTSNLNLKATAANTYDAIVIGSGISGGWAAKELTEKGAKTLLLERGRNVEHITDYPTAQLNVWDLAHRDQLSQETLEANPIVGRCYAYSEATRHFFVEDQVHPYGQDRPFDWIRGYQVGGKSLLWARHVQRWGTVDFEANLKDGYGVDWPIRYEDLAPWYSHVERFAGISGNRDGLPQIPDGEFQKPRELNVVEKHIKQAVENSFPGRNVISARTANLTEPLNGRMCVNRNLCNRGCPLGGYFSTNSTTLPAAMATGNLTLRPDSVVSSIIYDETSGKARGVRVIDAQTLEETEYYSKVIFLNASTINSVLILLNSTSNRFPTGLGNDSGVLGKYMLFHNYRAGASGRMPQFNDHYVYGKRPAEGYIPRFRNFGSDQQKAFLRGYAFSLGAYREMEGQFGENDQPFGAAFKENIMKLGDWKVYMGGMGEVLPNEQNRVYLHPDKKDRWGIPQIVMDIGYQANDDAMAKDIQTTAAEMLEAAGAKDISMKDDYRNPGIDIHEMGGARMGRDPKTSILNGFNQLHGVKNVFVTDGASMASTACQNPSLTYMAITARAAHFAADEIKKGNL